MEVGEIRIGAGDPRAKLFSEFVEEAKKYEMMAQKTEVNVEGSEEGEGEIQEPDKEAFTQKYHEMKSLIAKVEKAVAAAKMITETQPSQDEIAELKKRKAEELESKVVMSTGIEGMRIKKGEVSEQPAASQSEAERKEHIQRAEIAREEVIQRILNARESARNEKKRRRRR